MNKTKIEWCDYTWNPVTGCLHKCEYCYAAKIARRFASGEGWEYSKKKNEEREKILDKGKLKENGFIHYNETRACYPYGFDPTFHRHRLNEPTQIKKPQNIFVCSMADLFGKWVPDEWIEEVFEACRAAPQHRYLFLTKNGKRYRALKDCQNENMWFGQTITGIRGETLGYSGHNTFLSIEPLSGKFEATDMWKHFQWVIIGAETGNRKNKIIPKREWIEYIVEKCKEAKIPVFMKDSLWEIWGEPLIRQYPWEETI